MASAVIGSLRVVLGIDTAIFDKGLGDAMKSLKGVGKSMQKVGKSMSTYLTAPIVGFGALTLKTAGDFEMGMNQVKAVSGATGKQFDDLRQQAKDLGRTTQFSASQAADAMGFLAMAGFKADQILGAMPGTLQLAASAQMDLGTTADIVSNILQGYGKNVSELGHVNDVLVKAFTLSNTNLQQLGEAMKYAGPVANAAGVQFEEAAAALGMMGNAGIQASMAGTSLRGAISRILAPTKTMQAAMESAGLSFTDAQGKLLPLADIIEQLQPHADDAGLFMELFGQRAGPAMAALVGQGSDALRAMTKELENSGGTAKRIADVQMEGFNGQMRALKSAFEGLQLAIADSGLIEWMTKAATAITGWVQELAKTNPEILKWGTVVAGLAAVLGPVVLVVGTLAVGIAAIGAPVAAVIAGIAALTAGLIAFAPQINAAQAAIEEWVSAGWNALKNAVNSVQTALENLATVGVQAVANLVNGVQSWIEGKLTGILDSVKSKIGAVGDAFKWLYDKTVGHSWIPDMVTEVGQWMAKLGGNMVAPAVDAANQTSDAFKGIGQGLDSAFSGFGSSIAAAIKGTKEWSDVLKDVLAQIARLAFSKIDLGGVGGGFGGLITGLIGGLLGFANGGSFQVGGTGGVDSQLVAFRASPDERVTVTKPGQDGGSGGGIQEIVVRGVFVDDNAANQNAPQPVYINVNVSGARGNSEISQMVERGVRSGIDEFSRKGLPVRVQQIREDPRGIG